MPPKLPVLNLSLSSKNPALFAEQLRSACHEIGFFLIKHDHAQTCEVALENAREFFSREEKDKMSIGYENSPAFRGYMPIGVENTSGDIDFRQQIEYAAEYHDHRTRGDKRSLVYHRLRASNPWPDEIIPSFKPAIMAYVETIFEVAGVLRNAMCTALNVEPKNLSRHFGPVYQSKNSEPSFWSMKLVSYPPWDGESPRQGVGSHTDSNFLTLICQDPTETGLQVQSHNGEWIDVPATRTDTLVCNVGELAEIWSAGYFTATPHRVARKKSQQDRISLPIFYNPKLDAIINPIDKNNFPQWDRLTENQWRRDDNHLMASVGENSFKSLARSHPAVFERHHGDLVLLKDGRVIMRREERPTQSR